MHRLPALVAGSHRGVLPMADGSAAALVEVLLADEHSTAVARLAEAISVDPPLALWSVAMATGDGTPPEDVGHLAAWLVERAPRVLRWDPKQERPLYVADAAETTLYAGRVAEVLEVAGLAALAARSEGDEAADRAFLDGLLHEAPRWFMLSGRRSLKSASQYLPETLAGRKGYPVNPHVARTVEALGGKRAAEVPDDAARECRRRAAEAATHWARPAPALATLLPAIAARVARLAQLESRFHETLEAEKLDAMAEFAAGAGHEINNPLAVIAGRAQLFLQDEEDPERRRGLALINTQAKRVYEMIADMMLFARPPAPAMQTTELVALVDHLIAELAPRMAEQATTLSRLGHAGPLEIEADPTQLTVALRAMCRNAMEAIGHGGHVDVALADAGEHVEIRVSDDGPGVTEEARRHLFDPYFSARQAGRGLGLGLSKCWRIVVTNHGGRIDVDSRPGGPTVFAITLPKQHQIHSSVQ
jgi:hypothetical protein